MEEVNLIDPCKIKMNSKVVAISNTRKLHFFTRFVVMQKGTKTLPDILITKLLLGDLTKTCETCEPPPL